MRVRQFARWFVLVACLGVVVPLLATRHRLPALGSGARLFSLQDATRASLG
jgi:hypothetical protein